ncbi:hypothetical protein AVDCRST_MAG94-7073 [uncultured Leptolyngbya sp.]|uniref:EAL domain-containing protein n=1 Tax=uncultured Leptolyngbya sp. TaxID=332963 RepID=A0A6J4PRK0_9CYAN|nr:hypothetical protein AVDCRST_MAG94-7073 [uncultured Leptolyngbya sp.]
MTLLNWRDRIDAAIASHALTFHCQPIYRLHGKSPELFEVLVRLSENEAVIPAARFINEVSAEQLKAIDRLAVLGTLKHLQQTQIPHAVNLSGHTLNDPQFPGWIAEQLSKSGVNPRSLMLEITEQAALLLPSAQVISALRGLRFPLILDDLGSGYAAIPSILAIEPDVLKVDGSIVRLMAQDHWRECIVFSLMAGADRRGICLILEHVESALIESRVMALARQFPKLNIMVQGWLYGQSKPC